ncbi:MAG: hypothetical protein M1838_004625 [Thelocarpon superellum]|nr:MAG: hypothetical protein M1838_004625 [Thelocarpon superellum]
MLEDDKDFGDKAGYLRQTPDLPTASRQQIRTTEANDERRHGRRENSIKGCAFSFAVGCCVPIKYEYDLSMNFALILAHLDPDRQLYVNLDVSKEFGFGAHVFHADSTPLRRTPLVQPPTNEATLIADNIVAAHPAVPLVRIDGYRLSLIDVKDAVAFAALEMRRLYSANCQLPYIWVGDAALV